MTTNILLYKTMYNDNKHFIIHEDVFLLYKTMYKKIFVIIYSLLYNDKYFFIHEDVFLLYEMMYNNIFVVSIYSFIY